MSLDTFKTEFLARHKIFRAYPMKFWEQEGTLYCQAYNETKQEYYGNKFIIDTVNFTYKKAV